MSEKKSKKRMPFIHFTMPRELKVAIRKQAKSQMIDMSAYLRLLVQKELHITLPQKTKKSEVQKV